jgi:hypothetical protein
MASSAASAAASACENVPAGVFVVAHAVKSNIKKESLITIIFPKLYLDLP